MKNETKYTIIYISLLAVVLILSYFILDLTIENIGLILLVGIILLPALFIFFRKNVPTIIKVLFLTLSVTFIYLYLTAILQNLRFPYFLLILYPFLLIDSYSQKNEIKYPKAFLGLYIFIILTSTYFLVVRGLSGNSLNTILTIILILFLSAIIPVVAYKLHKEGKFIK